MQFTFNYSFHFYCKHEWLAYGCHVKNSKICSLIQTSKSTLRSTMYYLNGLTFKSLKIFVIIWVLVAFISPPSTLGNPITKRQFKKVVKLLEESIQTEIPSDDADQYSDVLFQEQYDKKNLTYYHAGDKTLPVFISNGFGNIGANIHVLLRGEDYINPKDQNDFVVLKKVGSPEGAYSVHRAYIV